MELQTPHNFVALIVGVTGMTGLSLAEALSRPDCLGGPWKVYGTSRRPLPSWFPPSLLDRHITFDALDVDDTHAKLSPISNEITHLFWLSVQRRDDEEANITINQTMLANVLNALLIPSTSLRHVTLQTGTKHYMGPIHDPVRSKQLINNSHAPPFHESMPRLPYPNFYYALEDSVASHAPKITYSVHRSSIIVGASTRSEHNALLMIAAYAAVCRHENLPFQYPGNRYTWEHFCDMTDAGVLAEQHVWAAVTPKARNEAFNCANGDVFTWKRMWKVMSEEFDVEYVEYKEGEEFDIEELMSKKGQVWDEIVEKYGLYETKLEEITCYAAYTPIAARVSGSG
ncbi:3-oxo-Delta(4,5)-steroid 5-beta-reductase-like [Senna tora]|uniref:3-oxo-Delta(4,5)-steroid 5-beta-reductase-like n=1 Tax=Senna tora TaxID=362788 RepID=A0A834X5C9_9FABA|nr:3-oxo-Delta(4,5)-steroid 5-beta-reductase-like [Senna tora]